MKTYTELSKLSTLEDRFEYLKIGGKVGAETFGFDRYLNQALYCSSDWQSVRDKVIIRDKACELGLDGFSIDKHIIVHHMNPITMQQIVNRDPIIFVPEYLICVSHKMHNAIHYGDETIIKNYVPVERKPGDTRLW